MNAFVSYDGEQNGRKEELDRPGPSGLTEQEIDARAAQGDRPEGSTEPLGRKAKEGYVYFIETEDGQFIKIGYSKQVLVRLSQLGTLRPGSFSLRVMGSIPGTFAVERWLHQLFADDRDNGEWFRRSERLNAFIQSLGLVPPVIIEREKPIRRRFRHRPLLIKSETAEATHEEAVGVAATCLRCGHEWLRRTEGRPRACPNCKQTRWDEPSQWAIPEIVEELPAESSKDPAAV